MTQTQPTPADPQLEQPEPADGSAPVAPQENVTTAAPSVPESQAPAEESAPQQPDPAPA